MGRLDDPEILKLAQELAVRTGRPVGEAVKASLRQSLLHTPEPPDDEDPALESDLERLIERAARLPVLDTRSADEILGYDDNGLPGRW